MNLKNDDFNIPVDTLVQKVVESQNFKPKSSDDIAFEGEHQLTLFNRKEIRKVFHNSEWYFSIVDVIEAITESEQPSRYWTELKHQLIEKEEANEVFGKIEKLKMPGIDAKMYPN